MSNIQALEARRLMAAPLLRVGSVTADNRGEVVIQLSERATGVKGAAVQLYTAGTDGVLFTNDDVRQTARITYSVNKKQIKLTATLAKDTPYRIKLDGKSRIKAEDDGTLLDGDFSGTLASGDGRAGGNFEAVFNRDTSSTASVNMRTSEGDISIRLRGDVAPRNAANFMSYANSRRFDNVIFTRGISGFIAQVGSLQVQGDGQDATDIQMTAKDPAITDEARVLHNARGTISFAKSGANSVTNQFFFNIGDNVTGSSSSLDEPTQFNTTFFTPFAEVTKGLEIVDAISANSTANLTSQIGSTPGTGTDAVPVRNVTNATNDLNPNRDLFIIYRVASVMKISAKS